MFIWIDINSVTIQLFAEDEKDKSSSISSALASLKALLGFDKSKYAIHYLVFIYLFIY